VQFYVGLFLSVHLNLFLCQKLECFCYEIDAENLKCEESPNKPLYSFAIIDTAAGLLFYSILRFLDVTVKR